MDGAARGNRRIGRLLVVRWLAGLLLVAVPVTFPSAGAAFTASTSDTANSVGAGTVAPPTGFAAGQTCSVSAITYVGASSGTSPSGNLVLSTPAGTAQNDLLIAHVTNRYDTGYTITAPAGWALINRTMRGAGAGTISSAVYWKLAGASEPATQSFVLSSNAIDMAGGIAAYRGISTSSPIDVSGLATGSGATVTTASVTTTVTNTRVVHLVTKRGEAQPALTGTTARWQVLSPTASVNQGSTAGDETVAATGATATRSSTGSLGTEWIAQTVALRPAPSIPSASLTWTASPTSGAAGYGLQRVVGGTATRTWTVTPISSTSTTDGTLVNGTVYTYRVWAYSGTWVSSTVTTTLTPNC